MRLIILGFLLLRGWLLGFMEFDVDCMSCFYLYDLDLVVFVGGVFGVCDFIFCSFFLGFSFFGGLIFLGCCFVFFCCIWFM